MSMRIPGDVGSPAAQAPCRPLPTLVEGTARVVAVDGSLAWLEPEQTGSCGGCAAAASCGSKGIGTLASRLEARRFPLAGTTGLAVGDRVVVGVREDALVKASLTAYALPLVTMFAAGAFAQAAAGRDDLTLAASVAGLALGLGIARLLARRLAASGQIAPRLLRRTDAPSCRPEGAST
jgi:sigma-E factor negative regulatory protein RseC